MEHTSVEVLLSGADLGSDLAVRDVCDAFGSVHR
jgi:hypothetical protein